MSLFLLLANILVKAQSRKTFSVQLGITRSPEKTVDKMKQREGTSPDKTPHVAQTSTACTQHM